MDMKLSAVVVLPALALLSACVETTYQSVPVDQEVARLSALGFRTSSQGATGDVRVMTYSGPITSAVACAIPPSSYRTMQPVIRTDGGAVQEFRLDAYLVLTPGTDGVLSQSERDGIYVVSKTTRPSSGARASDVEAITFEPGQRGTFRSGLSCRPT